MNKEEVLNEKSEMANTERNLDFPDFMSGIIHTLQAAGKYAAVHTYSCTLHSFEDFSGGAGSPMPTDEVFTPGHLKSYQAWLVRKELSWNSISTYMRTLRAAYNRLILPGSQGYNPKLFADVYTKVVSRTKRALTENQMQRLMTADSDGLSLEFRRTLAYFRLMFLFRGMPFIDLAHLRKCDWKGKMLTYCRHKTGRQLTVKVPGEAFPLLKMFRDTRRDSAYLFPILDSNLNDDYDLYRNYLDALRRFNKNLAGLSAKLLPGEKVSSYTARHTWATLCFHLGVSVGIISEALGHSSIRVTETYLKPFGDLRVDKANDKLINTLIKRKEKKNVVCRVL